MAEAIARALISANVVPAERIMASDPVEARRLLFKDTLGTRVSADNPEVVLAADVVMLAVKPQKAQGVLAEIGPVFSPEKLLVSIAAGLSTSTIEGHLPPRTKVVRAMPNTPMLVGAGMVGLAPGRNAGPDDLERAAELFRPAAEVIFTEERMIDVVTGLSGSGPAYFFYFIEAMVDAAAAEGLGRDEALKLAIQTARGAAELLAETGELPAKLRRKVTSPGGTTAAAIKRMESSGVKINIERAVRRAIARSRELGG
jgi:pyrroline-5-carboxylate reductase